MKNLYFLLILFSVVFTSKAQIITIPDANFKAKLLEANPDNTIAYNSSNLPITIDTNGDSEIQESEALAVTFLNLFDSNISDLTGIEYFTNLTYLSAAQNQLSTFSSNGLSNLTDLLLYNNNLTTVSLSNLSSLIELVLSNNQLTSISLTELTNLRGLYLSSNSLTTLDLTGLTYLRQIQVGYNQLTNIVFPDFPYPNEVLTLVVNSNAFETLAVPNRRIELFTCSDNPNLVYLNLKDCTRTTNLAFTDAFVFHGCPALEYLCVQNEDIVAAENRINFYGYTNCHVNTYCTFSPGGTYYTLQGTNTYDSTSNGCDSGDMLIPNMMYTISNGISSTTLVAGTNGLFNYTVSAGTYTITPVLENPTNFAVNPASAVVSFPSAGATFTQNFCITPTITVTDLEVALFPIGPAIPGFDAHYKIVYKNKGTQAQSGSVVFDYYDPIMDLVSSTPTASGQGVNTLTWNFSNLQPFETREIFVTVNLNSPVETPALNAGNGLIYTAMVIGATDDTPNDNSCILTQTVVNSFDPNDKTCTQGEILFVNEVGNYVHYLIRFENTGTFAAQNVVVKDVIDTTKFDLSTFVPLNASHAYVTRIINTNEVEFIFENINLPFDDATNDGHVGFKIKTLPTLTDGDTFSNAASIYFDFNAPIVTDTYTTLVFNPLNTPDFNESSAFSLSPVPAKNTLTITTHESQTMRSANIYNLLGQLVQEIAQPTETIDVSQLPSGNYILKITTDQGIATRKFIKE